MCNFYFPSTQDSEIEEKFAKNKEIFEWISRLPDDYSCFIEFSWEGSHSQSDFMIFGRNAIVNIEAKTWTGFIKGGLNDNWVVDGKSMGENPVVQSTSIGDSFKRYFVSRHKLGHLRDRIRVWPIVFLPNARRESQVPKKGIGDFGQVLLGGQELIDAVQRVRPLDIEINEGMIKHTARGLNLKITELKELRSIAEKYQRQVSTDDKSRVTDTVVTGYGTQFFGREKELSELANSIIRGDHAIIVGAQRTGKSSLMEELRLEGGRLFEEISNKLFKTLFVNIDFQGVGKSATRNEFEKRFKTGFINSINKEFDRRADLSSDLANKVDKLKFDSSLPQFLHRFLVPYVIKEYGYERIVFFLDEFSELIETIHNSTKCSSSASEMVDVELMRFISSLMKDRNLKGSVVYVLAFRPFYTRYHDLYDLQILKNISTPIGLDYFDFDTTKMLITTPVANKLDFSREAIDKIYSLTAGHPWFTSFFCKQLENKLATKLGQKKGFELQHITDLAEEMTGNEKSFQYEGYFTVLESDFSLEEEERKLGRQILAIVANVHLKKGEWPTFSDIYGEITKHGKDANKEELSDIIACMVNAKILKENRDTARELRYQIRMEILYTRYVNQNLYDRYFR